jgi:hypothetical protein
MFRPIGDGQAFKKVRTESAIETFRIGAAAKRPAPSNKIKHDNSE